MKSQIKDHLVNSIIPFWNSLADYTNGGFFGYAGYDGQVDKNADKGAILHSRILWFYSNCYLVLKDDKCLEYAKHCYDFMMEHLLDREQGGIYWMVSANGEPVDTMKHGYNQAFFIYALSSYYDASGDCGALESALEMFNTIETKMRDKIAYREACTRDWQDCANDALSENGIQAEKTMNTVLHLIEAYTELYRVNPDKTVGKRLENLLELAYDKLYDPLKQRLSVFFDKDMNTLGDVHSYGHDIEAAWLIGRAIDTAEGVLSVELCGKIRQMNRVLAEKIDQVAFDKCGAMYYESADGAVNKRRVWWAQAEALVGFLDAYRLYGDKRFLDRAEGLWEYIKAHVIDKTDGGEWFAELDENEVPLDMPTVDEWKCPYHNGRMCLEVINYI